jgi:hypothetical protein
LSIKADGLIKSGSVPVYVIPAQAGIQSFQVFLDSRLRGSDDSRPFYDVIKAVAFLCDSRDAHTSILGVLTQAPDDGT